ncbi:hypothetical protein BD779DRAFT_1685770 [Infundibulicybe gibba]|nr:hypothetical protein BD779DRAFT_1685770 [Infundibulicybe gibba]
MSPFPPALPGLTPGQYRFFGPMGHHTIELDEAARWCQEAWDHDSWPRIIAMLAMGALALSVSARKRGTATSLITVPRLTLPTSTCTCVRWCIPCATLLLGPPHAHRCSSLSPPPAWYLAAVKFFLVHPCSHSPQYTPASHGPFENSIPAPVLAALYRAHFFLPVMESVSCPPAVRGYLLSSAARGLMRDPNSADATHGPGLELLTRARSINSKILTLEDVYRHAMTAGQVAGGHDLRKAAQELQANIRAQKFQEKQRLASHREKRSLIYALGLKGKPYSFEDILARKPHESDPAIIIRNRTKSPVKLGTDMRDSHSDEYTGHAVINKTAGYHIVGPKQSVIFVSEQENGYQIELVVIRDVAKKGQWSSYLYAWLAEVTSTAVGERRDVRVSLNHLPPFDIHR